MPAALPGSTLVQNQANPTLGRFVMFDPISGPKGSPLDAGTFGAYNAATRIPAKTADPNNCSTGALCTGIGIGPEQIMSVNTGTQPQTAPGSIWRAGYDDNGVPGKVPTYAAGGPPPVVSSSAVSSTRMYLGGGRSNVQDAVTHVGAANPYTVGIVLVGAGNGSARDVTGGPAFQGQPLKMVTATGSTAVAAAVEAGFLNRSVRTIVTGESVFGVDNTASGTIS